MKDKFRFEYIADRTPQKQSHKGNNSGFLKRMTRNITFLGLAGILIVFSVIAIWLLFIVSLPTIDSFQQRKIANSTKIYDYSGEVILYDIHKNITRTVVDNDEISENIKNAVIAIEDKFFYEHNGIVLKSIARAIRDQALNMFGIISKSSGGGSTITQQVVKNTLLTPERTIRRKIKEWILAVRMDSQLSKDEILKEYLNEVPLGGTVYGVEEACRRFFGKKAIDVTVAEAAYIAAVINRPTYYSPYGQNREALEDRKNLVLFLMREQGMLSALEYQQARNEVVEFIPRENTGAKAIHFVEYVRAYLEEMYGTDMVENGGLQVITTLDYELQEVAENVAETQSLENLEKYNASNIGIVVLDPKTGAIRAMVGSRDYFDETVDGAYNVTLANRQPGSSFKPIAYATAFDNGYLPETLLFDVETQFNARCKADDFDRDLPCYSPQNYDNKFIGPISLRNALGQSRNIPAVKVLYLAGINNVMQRARKMGITSLTENEEYYGLSLVLGGGEVSLLEMAGAYGTLANDGEYIPQYSIIEIRSRDGDVLEKHEATKNSEERVIKKESARMVNSILSDNVARTPLFGSRSLIYFGQNRPVAGKTGTTDDNRDAWMMGYTDNIVVGVWTGNNDNTPMKKGSSISIPTWRAVMDKAIELYGYEKLNTSARVDNTGYPPMVRGVLPSAEIEEKEIEDVEVDDEEEKEDTEEKTSRITTNTETFHTILHWINKDKPSKHRTRPGDGDPQYQNWEYGVRNWLFGNTSDFSGLVEQHMEASESEEEIDDEPERPKITIFMAKRPPINHIAEIELLIERHDSEIVSVEYSINNFPIGSTDTPPFSFAFSPRSVSILELDGENILEVSAIDENGDVMRASRLFYVGEPVEF